MERDTYEILQHMQAALVGLQRQSESLQRLAKIQQEMILLVAGEQPEGSEPRRLSEQARKEIDFLEKLFDQSPDSDSAA